MKFKTFKMYRNNKPIYCIIIPENGGRTIIDYDTSDEYRLEEGE